MDGGVDEVVNNRANFHGCEYDVYFLQYHALTFMHFSNGERVCYFIRRTVFNV